MTDLTLSLPESLLDAIDKFRTRGPTPVSREEAIRQALSEWFSQGGFEVAQTPVADEDAGTNQLHSVEALKNVLAGVVDGDPRS